MVGYLNALCNREKGMRRKGLYGRNRGFKRKKKTQELSKCVIMLVHAAVNGLSVFKAIQVSWRELTLLVCLRSISILGNGAQRREEQSHFPRFPLSVSQRKFQKDFFLQPLNPDVLSLKSPSHQLWSSKQTPTVASALDSWGALAFFR